MTHARDHRGVKGGREGSRKRRSIESLPREKESDAAHRLRDRMAYQRISKISLLPLLAAATPRPGHQPIITIRYDYAIIVMQPVGLRNYAGELRYRVYVFQSARINKIKRPREAPISLFLSLSFSLSLLLAVHTARRENKWGRESFSATSRRLLREERGNGEFYAKYIERRI